jgi:phosphopantothenoylcysteine decarboxylase/phosphopantothenate--cysteine ligase
MLEGKKILLGVTGSIAAYKAATLVRLLVKQGAEVQVVMTPAATEFIPPLTLATLSGRPALTTFTTADQWNNHVQLGRWADLLLVAPASAHTLAKMAHGLCDNLLLAVYLSATCPVVLAPAMDEDMWHHPATRENLRILEQRGHHRLPVAYGPLASGLTGEGRMREPEDIIQFVEAQLGASSAALQGKKALVTAGPTYEPIDPVRFIGNHSSGKMGVALADALAARGAAVQLVLGPSSLLPEHPAVELIRVNTAEEMKEACFRIFPECDLAVLAAAVADYRPAAVAAQKIKKGDGGLRLDLVRNPDILRELGARKQPGQLLVGFSLETDHEEANARKKLREKHLDFIVLNSLQDVGAGFQGDTNKVTIFTKDGHAEVFPLKSKREVANDIVRMLIAAQGGTRQSKKK